MTPRQPVIRVGKIEQRILLIRGEKVIIDADLAEFYGASTKRLNEQVKRNKCRFPEDFRFQLTSEEKSEVVAKCDHLAKLKYSKALPHAFTERIWHGSRRVGEDRSQLLRESLGLARGQVHLPICDDQRQAIH